MLGGDDGGQGCACDFPGEGTKYFRLTNSGLAGIANGQVGGDPVGDIDGFASMAGGTDGIAGGKAGGHGGGGIGFPVV